MIYENILITLNPKIPLEKRKKKMTERYIESSFSICMKLLRISNEYLV
jgi:hypothetical protein